MDIIIIYDWLNRSKPHSPQNDSNFLFRREVLMKLDCISSATILPFSKMYLHILWYILKYSKRWSRQLSWNGPEGLCLEVHDDDLNRMGAWNGFI
jgi:hypothetical protein